MQEKKNLKKGMFLAISIIFSLILLILTGIYVFKSNQQMIIAKKSRTDTSKTQALGEAMFAASSTTVNITNFQVNAITGTITETGSGTVPGAQYEVKGAGTIQHYTGNVRVKVEVTVSRPINETLSNLGGATYNPASKKLTWSYPVQYVDTTNAAGDLDKMAIPWPGTESLTLYFDDYSPGSVTFSGKATVELVNDSGGITNTISSTNNASSTVNVKGKVEVIFRDKNTGQSIVDPTISKGNIGTNFDVAGSKKTLPGYTCIEEPVQKTGRYTVEDQVKVFLYAKTSYVYVKYVDKDTSTELRTQTVITGYEGKPFSTSPENIAHYHLVTQTSTSSETVMGEHNITVTYFYEINSYQYTVEYYYDDVLEATRTDHIEAPYNTTINDYTDKNKTGYKLKDKPTNFPLKITDDPGKNVIRVYYIKDTFKYTVNYYYDGVKDPGETETWTEKYKTPIGSYTNKRRKGYKLQTTSELPLIISEVESNNVINVYYVKDTFDYTIEYYYDGAKDPDRTVYKKAIYDSEITDYEKKLKTGYFEKTVSPHPLTITDDPNKNIMKVYYERETYDYKVEYYYDGEKDIDKTEHLTAKYNDQISVYPDKNKPGYELKEVKNLDMFISDQIANNVISVFYVRAYFDYQIQYYYDGLLDDTKTEYGKARYNDIISEYTNNIKKGYKLDSRINYPMTIVDSNTTNVMKIFYIIDPDNTKTLSYTVEYYKNGAEQELDTQVEKLTVQVLQPDTLPVRKERINLVNKYTGYTYKKCFSSTMATGDPKRLPDIVEDGTVIRIYYELNETSISSSRLVKTGTTAITKRKDKVSYRLVYEAIVNNYMGEGGVYLEDRLPYAIDETSAMLDGGTYSKADNSIVWHIDVGTIHTYDEGGNNVPKRILIEKNITVQFLDADLEKYTMTNDAKVGLFLPADNEIAEATADATTQINVDGQVTVRYIDKYTDEEIAEPTIKIGKIGIPYDVSGDKKDIEDYTLIEEPEIKKGEYTEEKQEKTYYYAKNTKVRVTYLEKSTGKEIATSETIPGYQGLEYETVKKEIEHYTFVESTDNVAGYMGRDTIYVIYYYELTKYSYRVEYYYDGKISDPDTDVFNVPFGTLIQTYKDKNIEGYTLDKDNMPNIPLKVGDNPLENVIKIYYVKDQFEYIVEYYYDGDIDNSKTDTFTATFKDIITKYEDKNIPGYTLQKTSKVPLTISHIKSDNIIKIFYVKDKFEYTVEYYYDGVKDDTATEYAESIYGNKIRTYLSKANIGYKLDTTQNLPLTITENEKNNVIRIYYVKADFDYIIEYYYDGKRDDTKTEFVVGGVYDDEIKEYPDKNIAGYTLQRTSNLPLTLSEKEEENVIRIYYVRDKFEYTIEYYYDGLKNDEKTETDTLTYGELVEFYEDKNIHGYKLETVDNFPMKITEKSEDNIMKVYYIIDPDNTKTLNYTVKYYKDGIEQKNDTEIVEQKVQILQPDIIDVKKEKINITNKYKGYDYKKISTGTVPDTVESGTIIKVYYELRRTEVLEPTLTKVSSDELTTSKDKVTYTLTYEAMISNYIGKAGVYLEDKLPYPIVETESTLDGGKYSKADNTIVWDVDLGNVNTFETGVNVPEKVKIVKQISLLYKDVDLLKDRMINNAKVGLYLPAQDIVSESIADCTSDINVNGQVKVKYIDKANNEQISEIVTKTGKVGDPFDVSGDKKEISGYTLIEEPFNKTGIYTEKGQERIYYYAKNSQVKVRYVDQITGEEIKDTEIIDGYEGKEYTTDIRNITNYTYVENTKNTSGYMTRGTIEVIYYYKYNTKVTVQYIDKETGEVLRTTVKEGLEGDVYDTVAREIPQYVLVESPGAKRVTMTKEEIIVRYYYSHISEGVIEKHIDEITGEILYEEIHEGKEGDIYVTDERKFEGYDLNKEKYPTNKEGRFTVDFIEVKYYYKRRTSVRVQYIDKLHDKKIIADVIIEGHEKDHYVAEAKEFEGYDLVKRPENDEGEMEIVVNSDGSYKTEILVQFYYMHISGGVIERHIDMVSGKILSETKHEGYEGDEYTTSEKEFPGYQLVKDKYPENKSGKMKVEPIEVTYYYVKNAQIIVQCINKYTGDIIKTETIDGVEAQKYSLKPRSFENYDFLESEGDLEGAFNPEETKVIKFYYSRIAKVTVRFVEKATNKEVAEQIIQAGYEGEEYITAAKEIKNMKLIELPSNATGIMAGDVNVVYYYRKLNFDISLEKSVKSLVIDGKHKKVSSDKTIKAELSKKNSNKSTAEIEYSIRVRNIGEVKGKANILEKISNGFVMYEKDNPGWSIKNNEARIKTEEILPGETRIYIIKLHWKTGTTKMGSRISKTTIESTENNIEAEEVNVNNNSDQIEVIVSVGTGTEKIPAVAIIALAYILAIVYFSRRLNFKAEEVETKDEEK